MADKPEPKDISVEIYRSYFYAAGGVYTIDSPDKLYILPDGGHRVVDKRGVTHAPARHWIGIEWEQSNGQPFEF